MTPTERELLEALKESQQALKDLVSQLPIETMSFNLDYCEYTESQANKLIEKLEGA